MSYTQAGILVVATLHASNAQQALKRLINFYPEDQHSCLLLDLASSIRAVVAQRLVRTLDGTRQPAVEVVLNTRHVAVLIEANNIPEIREAVAKNLCPGSQTFEHALLQMINSGEISQDEGLINADSATNLLGLLDSQQGQANLVSEPVSHSGESLFTEFTLDLLDT